MLTRVSCGSCRFGSLWTDDARGFLRSVCLHPERCEAKTALEGADAPRPAAAEVNPAAAETSPTPAEAAAPAGYRIAGRI